MSEAAKWLGEKTPAFIEQYLSGTIVDVGGQGEIPGAINVQPGHPDYNGYDLAYVNVDTVFSSHTLEHMEDCHRALRAWFAAVKVGGYLIIVVPHLHLYERKWSLPSHWNPDHKRFYTPAGLLMDIELALEPNSYRIRHMADHDEDFVYTRTPDQHPVGNFSIEVVLEKIPLPEWKIQP